MTTDKPASQQQPQPSNAEPVGGSTTGWPPGEDDLPVVADPNYCIDMERAA